jgi:cold shock CspA family protein
MANQSFETKFLISSYQTPSLLEGDSLIFKLVQITSSTADFTASMSQGNLTVSSLVPSIGYTGANCPFLETSSINNNEIILGNGITNFHDSGYIFSPNPLTEPPNTLQSTLYPIYGDVDYPFIIKPYDLMILYLNDGTYVEYTIINLNKNNGNLVLTLNALLSENIKTQINSGSYKNFLILTKIVDETNAYVIYNKRPGKTSYGFIIPDNLSPEVLANIDTITKEVKQKLLNEQQTVEVNSIDTLNGGGF